MDTNGKNIFYELNSMHCKVASLFQDVWTQRNQYRTMYEDLKLKLDKIEDDVNNLKKENRTLTKNNKELKVVINGICSFANIDMTKTKSSTEYKSFLEVFQKNQLDIKELLHVSSIGTENLDDKRKNGEEEINFVKVLARVPEDCISKEVEALNNIAAAQPFIAEEGNKDLTNTNCMLPRHHQESAFWEETMKETAEDNNSRQDFGYPSTSMTRDGHLSPVFKSSATKEPTKISYVTKKNCISGNCQVGVTKEKPSLEPGLVISRSCLTKLSNDPHSDFLTRQLPSTPKRSKRLRINCYDRSPSQLKKSNSKEVTITDAGTKKLTQTRLNLDLFKKKTPEKESKNLESIENFSCSVDVDDDLICESQRPAKLFDETIVAREKIQHSQIVDTGAVDLDETYVPSEVVKKYQLLTNQKASRPDDENATPFSTKLMRVVRSPEYESVPYLYKRPAQKKKSERMKLSGHACSECMKYYKDIFEDEENPENAENLREILNKCSRHRNPLPPSADETPPGYWKPFLTASFTSPNKYDNVT